MGFNILAHPILMHNARAPRASRSAFPSFKKIQNAGTLGISTLS
jgi:hypothetical protein